MMFNFIIDQIPWMILSCNVVMIINEWLVASYRLIETGFICIVWIQEQSEWLGLKAIFQLVSVNPNPSVASGLVIGGFVCVCVCLGWG